MAAANAELIVMSLLQNDVRCLPSSAVIMPVIICLHDVAVSKRQKQR